MLTMHFFVFSNRGLREKVNFIDLWDVLSFKSYLRNNRSRGDLLFLREELQHKMKLVKLNHLPRAIHGFQVHCQNY